MTTTDYGPAAGVVWVGPPADGHWATGRAHKICFTVIHTTESDPGPGAARAGHHFDTTRPDSVSTHCLHDSEESVQEVLRADTAFTAFPEGNAAGIQHEQCGFSSGDWESAVYQDTMRRCAKAVADDCKTYGLQAKHLSDDEMRQAYYHDGPGGIVGHGDITRVFPDPQADHTDPGPNFPWDQFVGMVKEEMGYVSEEDVIKGESALWDQAANRNTPTGRNFANDVYAIQRAADGFTPSDLGLKARLDGIDATLATILAKLNAAPPSNGSVADHEHSGGTSGPVSTF